MEKMLASQFLQGHACWSTGVKGVYGLPMRRDTGMASATSSMGRTRR